jgi:sortase A
MSKDRQRAEEMSIEELEALLARKKIEAREIRLRKFRRSGRALPLNSEEHSASERFTPGSYAGLADADRRGERKARVRKALSAVLLVLEIGAVGGLGYILYRSYGALQALNQEVATALEVPTPSPTPLITAVVLPSGHTPPTSPGGAQPNEAEIPENLRPLMQSLVAIPIPTPGPEHARSIFIPALWNLPAPVVQGDGWEQLKKGVGWHIGSANPGERGNVVLSAHNDIFGELFRDLDQLTPGDEIYISTATQEYLYLVTGVQIVEPTDVSILAPTAKATITLISCYPYMVDKQRIAVFGELVQ